MVGGPLIPADPHQVSKILKGPGKGIPGPAEGQLSRCPHVRSLPYFRETPGRLTSTRLIPLTVIRRSIHIRVVHIGLVRLNELCPTPRGVQLVPALPLRILQIRDELRQTIVKSLPLIHQSRVNRIIFHLHGQTMFVMGDNFFADLIFRFSKLGLMRSNISNKLIAHHP